MTDIEELEADESASITLNDVLGDAIVQLEKEGFLGMAIGVRMARAELGDSEISESYMRDMMEALESAECVVAVARSGKEEVNLSDLAEALEKVCNWGLDPHERMGNAMLHLLRSLHQVMFALENPEGGLSPTLIQNIRSLCTELGYEDMVSKKG